MWTYWVTDSSPNWWVYSNVVYFLQASDSVIHQFVNVCGLFICRSFDSSSLWILWIADYFDLSAYWFSWPINCLIYGLSGFSMFWSIGVPFIFIFCLSICWFSPLFGELLRFVRLLVSSTLFHHSVAFVKYFSLMNVVNSVNTLCNYSLLIQLVLFVYCLIIPVNV